MKRRINMALPLVFVFFLTLLPFRFLSYNQLQRQLIKQQRATELWEKKAGNYLQLFRSMWSYEDQIRRRMYSLHTRVQKMSSLQSYGSSEFMADLRYFFPQKQLPVAVYAGYFDEKKQSLELFAGDGYASVKQRIITKILEGFARSDSLAADETRSLNSLVRGAFGDNLTFDLIKNHRRSKSSRVMFSGAMRFVYWDILEGANGQKLVYLQVFAPDAVSKLDTMKLANRILSSKDKSVVAILVPLEFSDPDLKPVFDPYIADDQRQAFNQLFARLKNKELKRNRVFPIGEFFNLNDRQVLRDFIDYAVPYEIWLMSRDNLNAAPKELPLSFVLRLFFFSAWCLIFAKVLIAGRPIGISLRVWLTLIFLVVGVLPLAAFFVAGIFHIDSAAYRREQEAIKNILRQLEEADSSGEALMAEYRDFCQRLEKDEKWLGLLSDWNLESWEKAWDGLPEKFERAGLHVDAMYVYPPDVASLTSKFFVSTRADVDLAREKSNQSFYEAWIKRCYYELAPEIMDKNKPDLPLFKGRSGDEIINYFLSNRGDIEFLDLDNEKFFIYQNYVLKNGTPHNWYFFRINILRTFEKYLSQSIANLQEIFAENVYSIAMIDNSQAKIVFPKATGKNLSLLQKVAGRWMDLAAITRTRTIEQTDDYLVVTYPCLKSGPYILTGIVFFNGFRAQAFYQEMILSIIVALMIIPVFLISRFTAGYLVNPLVGVESGLKRIAEEDFSISLKLTRNDELGKLTSAFDRMVEGLRERRNLGKFVSATLDEQVARDDTVEQSGLTKRFGAILCADIRGFTSLSENYPVREIVAMLNDHLAEVSRCITNNDGLVEQFIGDAVLAVFHADTPAEVAEKALKAAEEIIFRHRQISENRKSRGAFTYGLGVGVDAGSLISGIIQAGARREYAVVGAVRSRAEKLEARSKVGKYTKIIVSRAVYELVAGRKFAQLPDEEAFELVGVGGET